MLNKRLSLLALSLVVLIAPAIIATRYISGQSTQQPRPLMLKVLRGKDHLKNKPSKAEIASFRTSQETERRQQLPEERHLEDKIPKHLPIKINLKTEKEKAFKDLKNDRWVRDFELEVKNTGNRPIYYLVLLLNLPELRVGTGNLLFDLRFGDKKFLNFAAGAKPEDTSLKPGETHVFKIEGGSELNWEDFSRGKTWSKPKRFELLFQELNFGDGTGFRSTDGAPWPTPGSQADVGDCGQASLEGLGKAHHGQFALMKDVAQWQRLGGELARNLPATFFSEGALSLGISSTKVNSRLDSCCTGDGCLYVHEYDDAYACAGINCRLIHRADTKFCFEPGSCKKVDINYRACHVLEDGISYWHNCPYALTSPCPSNPTPPPTPTPSPSPTPTPIPCPFTAASNCASGVPRDYCLNPDRPEINIYTGGCPPLLRADGNCCVPIPCPSPTPAPPPCSGTLIFNPSPTCSWTCASLSGGGAGNIVGYNEYECTTYYWSCITAFRSMKQVRLIGTVRR